MGNFLIGAHAFIGELGIAAFLWVFIEMLSPTQSRLKRAQIAALLGIAFFFASWIVGGFYYVEYYGIDDGPKSVIKGGPEPWAHSVFTETKEHMFLFLPFISIFAYALLRKHNDYSEYENDPKLKKSILWLSGLIVVIGGLMAFMGYLISSGVRAGLEAGI